MKPTSQKSADIITSSIEDVRLMLANWPQDHPEMRAKIKELRRDLKVAAKIVAASVTPQGELFTEAS